MAAARTIREQVTDQIRDDVVAGKFKSGEPLRESEVAKRLGVSHGPVRDAFLQLTQEGFLAYQANRGVTVRQPPNTENREFIVSLRQQVELFVVRRGFHLLALDRNVDRLETALRELKVACLSEEVASIARTDMAFHQVILEICDGIDFLPLWKWLCSQMLIAYSRLDDYEQVYQEHAQIFDAMRSGKKQAATNALKANIR